MVWRGTGGERPGERWQEVYGRWEKRGKQDSQGGGKQEKNYATLCNVLQSKKCKEAGANKYREGTGIKGYGKWEV